MPYQQLATAVAKFTNVRALVVGDAMLDHYVVGKVERISPEAPVPVLQVSEEFDRVGGAANVAANVTSLGANAALLALAGNENELDETGKKLVERCHIRGVVAEFIPALAHTVKKSRMLAGQHQLLRVDWETPPALSPQIKNRRAEILAKLLATADVILISDYAKGAVDAELMEQVIASRKKVIVDPRPQHGAFYRGATLITPNRNEALAMLRPDGKISDEELGERLSEKLDADILLTLSENGVCLCERGKPPLKIPARARDVFDVTGAGDTVAATFAVAAASGVSFVDAAYLANAAAGVVVGHVGAAAITADELRTALAGK